jgi:hypothetical protein
MEVLQGITLSMTALSAGLFARLSYLEYLRRGERAEVDDLREQVDRLDALEERFRDLAARMPEANIVTIREVPESQARNEILDYIRSVPQSVLPSQIAIELHLEYALVSRVVRELVEAGDVESE